ncbi:hypothetical protein RvY_01372 [Ramazzottius varieornatus]|uniref:DNA polymerase epsilon subunit n=1 Tax=Ramazzottius varieornatus TaxID=947166 RepID=A0A1D1UQT2_RAMVA|nr:hypothetical protein RvY_01372 [Ramazzottius varieornatus]
MTDITKYFRLNGINIRSEAAQYLSSLVADKSAKDRKLLLEQVIKHLQRQSESSLVITRQEIEIAVKEFAVQDDTSGTEFFWVYDAFSLPVLYYDPEKKHYTHASALNKPPPKLHENAEWKNFSYVDRYEALFYRALRNPLFMRPAMDRNTDTEGRFTLHLVEELLSSSNAIYNTVVLGMISSLQEGKYHLEDPTGAIELDIGVETSFHSGLFVENVFVIVEGWYDDRVFHATGLGMPPPETRTTTQIFFGDFNFFGGPSQVSLKASTKLLRLEGMDPDAMFVFLADVWLDKPDVLERMDKLFKGFSSCPPFCFVLCGDFVCETENLHHGMLLKNGLKDMGSLIQRYSSILRKSRFVFVPGPMDIGGNGMTPRPRLPKNLTVDFEKTIPNAVFTSNPCRIQYCTKEIVVMREDILTKMCRTLIKDPPSHGKETRFKQLSANLAKTILAQGHLCPLPAHILPVYWSYDHTLRLTALPDLVVIADIQEPFAEKYAECFVANPSSFPRHKYQFHVYMPCRGTIELSQID